MPTDLWNFALACYARPGVEALCLRLQAGGADVCLLLCALWLERRRVACDGQRLDQLRAIAEPWQRQVVQPLRELRGFGRAERAFFDGLAAADAGELQWSAVAIDAGYFDQPHMNRASRRITGFAPEELRRRIAEDEGFWAYRVWQ